MMKLHTAFNDLCATIIGPVANLWARIYIGYYVFFSSGLAKLDDFEETIELFDAAEDGEFALPFLPAEPAAYMATAGELILPVLLILGLFTRFSAAGLFVMAAVIQFFVFPEQLHIFWMIVCAMLVGYGGNTLSLDNFLLKIKK